MAGKERYLIIVLLILLIIPLVYSAETTLTQGKLLITGDTVVNLNFPNTNYGTEQDVEAINGYKRSYFLVNFTNLSASSITSAYFNIYYFSVQTPSTVNYSISWDPKINWTESGMTWANQPCSAELGNTSIYCNNTLLYSNVSSVLNGVTGYIRVNVTEPIRAALSTGKRSLTFYTMMNPESAGGNSGVHAWSRENVTFAPFMNISYLSGFQNTSWSVTSGNTIPGEDPLAWNYGGNVNITTATLSLSVDSGLSTNMSCRIGQNQNYTTMLNANSSYKASTTETNSHTFTVGEEITYGNHCLYCAFIQSNGTESTLSDSGCLNFTLLNVTVPSIQNIMINDTNLRVGDIVNLTAFIISTGQNINTYSLIFWNATTYSWNRLSSVDVNAPNTTALVQFVIPANYSFFAWKWQANTTLGIVNVSQESMLLINYSESDVPTVSTFYNQDYTFMINFTNSGSNITYLLVPNWGYVLGSKLRIGGLPTTTAANSTLPSGVTVNIAGTQVFNYSGNLTTSYASVPFDGVLNTVLAQQCTCVGCSLISSGCLVPVNVTVAHLGSINLQNLGFNETITVKNCTDGNSTSLILNGFDEITLENISTNLDITLLLYSNGVNINNATRSFRGNWSYRLCSFPPWINLTSDVKASYNATGYSNRNYFSQSLVLSNITQNISFYLLTTDASSTVLINVKDNNGVNIEGAVVKILRFYPGTGRLDMVQSLQTDFNGNTIAKLTLYDVFYKIIVEKDGQVVFSSDPRLITGTIINLNTNPASSFINVFTNLQNASYSLTYNNITQRFTFTYSSTSDIITGGCLKVIKKTASKDYSICNTCSTSVASSIQCQINQTEQGAFVATGQLDFIGGSLEDVARDSVRSLFADRAFGLNGVFMASIFILTLGFLGLFSPVLAILFTVVGFIFAVAMGFYPLPYVSAVSVIVVGVILMTRMKE